MKKLVCAAVVALGLSTPAAFAEMLRRFRSARHVAHFVRSEHGDLVGVVNLSEIVMGAAGERALEREKLHRYSLALRGGTGSPANPIAIF